MCLPGHIVRRNLVTFGKLRCEYLGYKTGDFPESESAALETLAIPIYPELTEDQQRYVVDSIRSFVAD